MGLCAERCVEMVVGMLGIWKAGGAYVPLDPETPGERMEYMLKEAGVTVVLGGHAKMLEGIDGIKIWKLDEEWNQAEAESEERVVQGSSGGRKFGLCDLYIRVDGDVRREP